MHGGHQDDACFLPERRSQPQGGGNQSLRYSCKCAGAGQTPAGYLLACTGLGAERPPWASVSGTRSRVRGGQWDGRERRTESRERTVRGLWGCASRTGGWEGQIALRAWTSMHSALLPTRSLCSASAVAPEATAPT